ncbi:bifunctional DNA-formamidopyrimidine glycosylase/DNA-(apurinic or apyrimidinic site) lyase [Staphylococcus chromogenes]|nr:bifunctional DNA-formamidopyrimidine glycosylase/DNA-(apurinic or apyrimidinic site) lyase [Staphylococcus chromogenes]
MPELPEVEVVRRGLAQHLAGRTIESAEVIHPRVGRRQAGGGAELVCRLSGRRIEEVARRGKYLWTVLDSGEYLLIHLGMSGQMLIKNAGTPTHKHLRARLLLGDSHEAWFVDQRTFGAWQVGELIDGTPEAITHIARDPFDPEFSMSEVAARILAKNSSIKRVLLDQSVVSGFGNIYADEALWRAKIHGETPASALSTTQVISLLDAGKEVMANALAQGGTSFDALYVNVNGESGYFSRSLNVYGQAGAACPRCGTQIVRETFMNRGSHFCPTCQPLS